MCKNNIVKKTTNYCFRECSFGYLEFTIYEDQGKITNISLVKSNMVTTFTDTNHVKKFTDWIYKCMESIINEHTK